MQSGSESEALWWCRWTVLYGVCKSNQFCFQYSFKIAWSTSISGVYSQSTAEL